MQQFDMQVYDESSEVKHLHGLLPSEFWHELF